MARPKKEGLDYFPHDTDSTGDIKIEAMLLLYGGMGYAFYFMLLELIYRDASQELDISDAETLQILSRKLQVSDEQFGKMLGTALSRGLFDRGYYEKTGRLTSNGIKKRAYPIVSKREKSSFSYENSKAIVSDAETLQKPDRNDTKKRKEKHSIEKQSTEDNVEPNGSCPASRTPTTPPSAGETSEDDRSATIREIISFLNATLGTSYKSSCEATRAKITARLNEGFTLDDFKTVILKKSAEWGENPEMCKYLRPDTLFSPKFEGYLNQPEPVRKSGNPFLALLEGNEYDKAGNNDYPCAD